MAGRRRGEVMRRGEEVVTERGGGGDGERGGGGDGKGRRW